MGWSQSMQIGVTDDHFNTSLFSPANATWFQKSWWSKYDWGWIYTNDTAMSIKLTSATFNACAGHSNGKWYSGGGPTPTLITYGYGCTFTSDIRAIDSSGNHIGEWLGIGSCDIESITEYNCYYGGYGNVCTTADKTSFGNPAYFSGIRAWHPIVISYDKDKSPAVPPGGKLIVTIRPIAWKTSGNDALLVMRGDGSNFTSSFEPENDNYIWECIQQDDGSKVWKKTKKAFIRTASGWEEMKNS